MANLIFAVSFGISRTHDCTRPSGEAFRGRPPPAVAMSADRPLEEYRDNAFMMKHYDIDYDDQALFKSSVNKDSYRWLMDARIRIARTKAYTALEKHMMGRMQTLLSGMEIEARLATKGEGGVPVLGGWVKVTKIKHWTVMLEPETERGIWLQTEKAWYRVISFNSSYEEKQPLTSARAKAALDLYSHLPRLVPSARPKKKQYPKYTRTPTAPLSKALPLVDWSYVARLHSPFPLAVEQRMAFKVLEDWMPHDEWKWTVWDGDNIPEDGIFPNPPPPPPQHAPALPPPPAAPQDQSGHGAASASGGGTEEERGALDIGNTRTAGNKSRYKSNEPSSASSRGVLKAGGTSGGGTQRKPPQKKKGGASRLGIGIMKELSSSGDDADGPPPFDVPPGRQIVRKVKALTPAVAAILALSDTDEEGDERFFRLSLPSHQHRQQGNQVFTGRTSAHRGTQVAKKAAAPAMERTRESEEMSVQSDGTLSEEEGGGRVEDMPKDSVRKAKQGKKRGQAKEQRVQKANTVKGQGRGASTEALRPPTMPRRGGEAHEPRDQGTQAGGASGLITHTEAEAPITRTENRAAAGGLTIGQVPPEPRVHSPEASRPPSPPPQSIATLLERHQGVGTGSGPSDLRIDTAHTDSLPTQAFLSPVALIEAEWARELENTRLCYLARLQADAGAASEQHTESPERSFTRASYESTWAATRPAPPVDTAADHKGRAISLPQPDTESGQLPSMQSRGSPTSATPQALPNDAPRPSSTAANGLGEAEEEGHGFHSTFTSMSLQTDEADADGMEDGGLDVLAQAAATHAAVTRPAAAKPARGPA